MRYMMLVMAPSKAGPAPPALVEERNKWVAESTQAGEFVDGAEFDPAKNTATVRLRSGTVEQSDGPFAEAKEVVGGVIVLDFLTQESAVKSANEFLELHAKHWPGWEGSVTLLPFKATQTHHAVLRST